MRCSYLMSANLSFFSGFRSSLFGLPEELIVCILQYIPLRILMSTMAIVSKEAYRICHLPALWRRLSLRNVGCIYYSHQTLHQLFYRHGKDFRYIYFGGNYSPDLSSLDVESSLSFCRNVSSLDIGTNGLLESLSFLRWLSHIKRLVLDFCTEIDVADMVNYVSLCPTLEIISVYRCTQLTYPALLELFAKLPQLTKCNAERAIELGSDQVMTLLNVRLTLIKFQFSPIDEPDQNWQVVVDKFPGVMFGETLLDLVN